jgi:tellurite resistance protein TerC
VIRRFGAVSYQWARRIVIGVIGGTILLVGLVMMLTPGPGIAGVLLGLAILAVEFAWARAWLARVKHSVTPDGRRELKDRIAALKARFFGPRNGR